MPITVSGTQITFNNGTVQTTAFTGGGGTVTSVATGNGLSGGTITTSGTLTVACPGFNTVGSYAFGFMGGSANPTSGTNYSANGGQFGIQSAVLYMTEGGIYRLASDNLSGTWKWMGGNAFGDRDSIITVVCRVS
jgi:hypothetical protein